MIPSELRDRVLQCRAATQTDSLTVVMDLTQLTANVVQSVKNVLQLPEEPAGADLALQDPATFTRTCQLEAAQLLENSEGDAIEFATVMSSYIHECRHVHDLRSTWMGSELLLHDLQAYSGIGRLLTRLTEWQSVHSGDAIPLPIVGEFRELFTGEFQDIGDQMRDSNSIRSRVSTYWNTPSRHLVLPGLSLQDLFEYVRVFGAGGLAFCDIW